MTRYRPLSDFATAFAAQFKAHMHAEGVTNLQVAAILGRNDGYVSERANGRRALDTEDIDALASLTGWSGKALAIELATRARAAYIRPEDELAARRRQRVGDEMNDVGVGDAAARQLDPDTTGGEGD